MLKISKNTKTASISYIELADVVCKVIAQNRNVYNFENKYGKQTYDIISEVVENICDMFCWDESVTYNVFGKLGTNQHIDYDKDFRGMMFPVWFMKNLSLHEKHVNTYEYDKKYQYTISNIDKQIYECSVLVVDDKHNILAAIIFKPGYKMDNNYMTEEGQSLTVRAYVKNK